MATCLMIVFLSPRMRSSRRDGYWVGEISMLSTLRLLDDYLHQTVEQWGDRVLDAVRCQFWESDQTMEDL